MLSRSMPMMPRWLRAFSTKPSLRKRMAPESTIAALQELLGDRFSSAHAVCEQHGRDESYHAMAPPQAVAYAQSTQEVSQIIKLCAASATPVIPFGAGSSLEGHISALEGGISLDLSRMNAVMQVEPENMDCKVQAGVTRQQLNTELRATGLFFPVDPGADATLGGMVATNASGTTSMRYGNMRTNVLSLTAVLADGRIIKTGSRARKSSAGYDLTRLLIGSEGTLGVVTEVSLLLHGIPEAEKTMVCSFPSIKSAVDMCTSVIQMGIPMARMELMDENAAEVINKYSKLNNPVAPSLILEHHGSPTEIEEQSLVVQELAAELGAQGVQVASTFEDRKQLWSGRHACWWATMHLKPGSRGLCTDVAVPISKLPDVIVETQEDMGESGLYGTIVGHVGDGNFHVMLPFTEGSAEMLSKVKAFSDRLVRRSLAAGGTCTGEHGIGSGKMDYLRLEHGESVDVMRTIKHALDPLNILNPGKIFYGSDTATAAAAASGM